MQHTQNDGLGGVPGQPEATQAILAAQLALEDEHTIQLNKRKQSDSETIVICMCGLAVVNSFLLIVPMLGSSWAHRSFVGLGIKIMHIQTSLFSMTVDIHCGKNFVEDVLCRAGDRMNGQWSLHQGQSMSCAISRQACDVMGRIYFARLIIFILFSVAIIMLGVGAVFLYHYWFIEAAPKVRHMGVGLYSGAPFVGMFGMALWSLYVPDLSELPAGWTSATSVINGLSLFGYHAIVMFPYGWCWIWSAVVFLEMSIFLCIWPWFFTKSAKEEEYIQRMENAMFNLDLALAAGSPSEHPGINQQPAIAHAVSWRAGQNDTPMIVPMTPSAMPPQMMGPPIGQRAPGQEYDFGLPAEPSQNWQQFS